MKINQAGIELIEEAEGLRLEAYKCPAGVWTIGIGHTGGVKPGDRITSAQAMEFLLQDLEAAEQAVSQAVKVSLTTNQFSALVSFVYNFGATKFRASTLLRLLNAGEYFKAADEFPRWCMAGGRKLPGLVRRRMAEQELFLRPDQSPKL